MLAIVFGMIQSIYDDWIANRIKGNKHRSMGQKIADSGILFADLSSTTAQCTDVKSLHNLDWTKIPTIPGKKGTQGLGVFGR